MVVMHMDIVRERELVGCVGPAKKPILCRSIEERSLHPGADALAPFEAQGLREANAKKRRRLTSVGMTGWLEF
jgi:hypothetical protein